jgi:uncharacterized protein (TIGR02453 family)
MATVESFSGFPKKTVAFLLDLAANNNREWFTAHRQEYEALILEPAKAFVRTMGQRLQGLSPRIKAEPRIDGSLFRIFRDTRFTADKSPYKTNLGIYFWQGPGSRLESSGYYFHLEPPALMLGGGMYIFSKSQLEHYRRAVADPEYGAELAAIVKKIKARPHYTLGGEHYKRVPAGYGSDPAVAGLLRHSGLYAGCANPIPAELYTPALINYCWERFKPMEPLQRWLATLASGGFEL